MFDALNYGIEEENKKKDYEHHSLVIIFIPLKKGYHAYLINSHGIDTKDYTTCPVPTIPLITNHFCIIFAKLLA